MGEGLVPPCPGADLEGRHTLLTWVTKTRNRRTGLVLLGVDKLYYQYSASEDNFAYLRDIGYIEKVTVGESYRYRVLVFCTCKGDDSLRAPAAGGSEPIMREAQMGEPRTGLEVGPDGSLFVASRGVKSRSVQNTVQLARDFFPLVLERAGMDKMPDQKVYAIAHHLNMWKTRYDYSLSTMRLMMEEFGRHADWCRRSKKPAWQIFLGRHDELHALVSAQQKRDPAARRFREGWTGEGSYWNRHTPRSVSPA